MSAVPLLPGGPRASEVASAVSAPTLPSDSGGPAFASVLKAGHVEPEASHGEGKPQEDVERDRRRPAARLDQAIASAMTVPFPTESPVPVPVPGSSGTSTSSPLARDGDSPSPATPARVPASVAHPLVAALPAQLAGLAEAHAGGAPGPVAASSTGRRTDIDSTSSKTTSPGGFGVEGASPQKDGGPSGESLTRSAPGAADAVRAPLIHRDPVTAPAPAVGQLPPSAPIAPRTTEDHAAARAAEAPPAPQPQPMSRDDLRSAAANAFEQAAPDAIPSSLTRSELHSAGSVRGPRARGPGAPIERTVASAPQPADGRVTRLGDPAASPLAPSAPDVGGAKPLTVVSGPTPAAGGEHPTAGERLRGALASLTNHAVIRSTAGGLVDVPELGRVEVRAHGVGGVVDVNVSTERADARGILRAHAGALAADLRQADVPLAHLTIDRAEAGHHPASPATPDGAFGSSASWGERNGRPQGAPRHPGDPADEVEDAPDLDMPAQRRVRIVL